MSVYFRSLSDEVKARYLTKIKLINNVDPYDCDESGFSENIALFPKIVYGDIYRYLVLTKSAYTDDDLKAFKSLDAYKFFTCGWVRDVKVKHFGENVLILGKVMHSQRLNEKLLLPWIIAKFSGEILCGHCTCVAGLGEVCSHLAAVLFAIEDAKMHAPEVSVTGVKASWRVPHGPVDEIGPFSETATKTRVVPGKKFKAIDGEDRAKFLMEYYKESESPGTPAPILLVSTPICHEVIEEMLKTDISNPLLNIFSEEHVSLSLDELRILSDNYSLPLTEVDCTLIEEKTRGQSDNKMWFQQRTGRITASNFKKACSTDPEHPAISTIKTICYPTKFSSRATEYGCRHEKDALKCYTERTHIEHQDFSVTRVGLQLSPMYPHFGASPDSVVSCSCCGDGCVEVKCPYCMRDQKFDAKLPPYLKKDDSKIELKETHAYYYQVQMQMAICNKQYCDFVVWTSKDILVQRIPFDDEFWQRESAKATEFWRIVILPELLGKIYTRLSSAAVQQSTASAEEQQSSSVTVTPDTMLWCYCKKPDDGARMISCDNSACRIKWFHMKCLGMKNSRKVWFCKQCELEGKKPMKKTSSQ